MKITKKNKKSQSNARVLWILVVFGHSLPNKRSLEDEPTKWEMFTAITMILGDEMGMGNNGEMSTAISNGLRGRLSTALLYKERDESWRRLYLKTTLWKWKLPRSLKMKWTLGDPSQKNQRSVTGAKNDLKMPVLLKQCWLLSCSTCK